MQHGLAQIVDNLRAVEFYASCAGWFAWVPGHVRAGDALGVGEIDAVAVGQIERDGRGC